MNEFQFIAITLLFSVFAVIIVDWIITRYRHRKTIIPNEKFEGKLNDLDKIIEGVSTDGTEEKTTETVENEKNTDENNNDEKDDSENENHTADSSKNNDENKTKSSTSLKNAMITKEILTPKHSDKQ